MRKIFIGVAAAAVIAAPLAATTSANAAVGDEYVQHGGFGDAPANVLPDGSSTEFTPANLSLFGEWANVRKGTMYDPGTFTVASNPVSLHEFWAPFPGDDQMMIVNGHTDGTHTVWKQTVDTSAASPSSTTTLWAGQNENVGTVTVSPDPVNAGKFCVKYDLSDQAVADGYGITQVHVASGADAAAIPQKNGNPNPGGFPVKETYPAPGLSKTTVCNVDAGPVFATHAALTKTVDGAVVATPTGWSGENKLPGKNWATYSGYKPMLKFKFSMNATNVLRQGIVDGTPGAQLAVTLNGTPIGAPVDLTGSDPGHQVVLMGSIADTDSVKIEIRNNATNYSGNDFAIDDISLVQVA